jgi:hypothetical protein
MRYWLAGLIFIATPIAAQEHFHPPADVELHHQFYLNWLQPNKGRPRFYGCCNFHDCYPTAIRNVGGTWFARRREDGKWIVVPDERLEQLQSDPRESPDGQSHACMPPPVRGDIVYCAVLGSAI